MFKSIIAALVILFLVSCKNSNKSNNCKHVQSSITEKAKDSACLIEYWNWNLHLAPVKNYNYNGVIKNFFLNRRVYNTGNTIITMMIDELSYPHFFVKMKTDSTYFRMIFEQFIDAEDTSSVNGEIRLYNLEGAINYSSLDNRFKYYNKRELPIDTLSLIHTHFANRAYHRIAQNDDSILFKNVHKYDSILFAKMIDNNFENLFKYFYEDTNNLTKAHYHFLNDYFIETELKLKYDYDIDKASDKNRILETTMAALKPKILSGYMKGLKDFEDFKKAHKNKLHKFSIFYSLPDFKFYIIRNEEKPGQKRKIFLRVLNSEKEPARIFSFIYRLPLGF